MMIIVRSLFLQVNYIKYFFVSAATQSLDKMWKHIEAQIVCFG